MVRIGLEIILDKGLLNIFLFCIRDLKFWNLFFIVFEKLCVLKKGCFFVMYLLGGGVFDNF